VSPHDRQQVPNSNSVFALQLINSSTLTGGRLLQTNAGRLASPLELTLALTCWCQSKCKTLEDLAPPR